MTAHLLRLWVIGSYEMPRCDWLQHCNFLAGIEILPIALQTACKPCGFATGRPAIVAGAVLRVAIGESCSMCRALKWSGVPCANHMQHIRCSSCANHMQHIRCSSCANHMQHIRCSSCANHMQHIRRSSCATCCVPHGTKGQLSC